MRKIFSLLAVKAIRLLKHVTNLLVLQHPPLLPHELEDGDEAGRDHPGVEHDEDATQIRQAKLGAVALAAS